MSWTTYNPATGVKIANWNLASAEEVEKALQKLNAGFHQWKNLNFKARQAVLMKAVNRMKSDALPMAQTISTEMGKPLAQAKAEVDKSIQAAEYLCQSSFPAVEELKVENKTYSLSRVVHEPLGVIVSVMPWNFPLWQVVRMIFPNLLMGNTVLLKHSEITPHVGDKIAQYFDEIWSENILVHTLFSHDRTESIVADERVGGLSLTGSTRAGYLLSSYAGKYLKKSVFELGGSDGYMVCEDADIQAAAKKLAKGRLQNSGQSCIGVKRVVVQRKILDSFLDALKSEFSTYQYGSDIGPLAHSRFKAESAEKIQSLQPFGEIIFEKNAEIDLPHTAFAPLQIMLFKKNPSPLKTLELFCPTLAVIVYDHEEEALQILNSTDYGLGGGVFSQNIEKAFELSQKIKAGQVSINSFIQSDVKLPFGGIKSSGLGREMGQQGFFEFTQTKVYNIL